MSHSRFENKLKRATAVVCKQGMFPFPVTDTALAVIRQVVGENEEEIDLICAFDRQASQTIEQLVESSGFSADRIDELTARLAKKGLIFNQPSSAGIKVYRLLPLVMIGLMEYRFMTKIDYSEEERNLARLFEKLFDELRDQVQSNIDVLLPRFKAAPAVDRTVPVRETVDGRNVRIIPVARSVDAGSEAILTAQTVAEIIDKFDDIAVGHCFCRQRRALLGDPCDTHAPTECCFTFGKSARHTVAQGFARAVSRQEAKSIMHAAEEAGLIHKAFHPASRETRPETSICNCCKDCCDTFRLWREGTLPLINSTNYLSIIDPESCTGCETCLSWCPTDAISINDAGVAERDRNACLGCGLCARFCPEEAIALEESPRRVFIPPQRQDTIA